ncbi:MAG: hypothetical protein AB8G11_22315 [Saprospiraceae bacterium]
MDTNFHRLHRFYFQVYTYSNLITLNSNLVHHRGQLTIYLRLKNVKPPRYIGW